MAAKLTTVSQNSDTNAPSGGELYHSNFSLQAASTEVLDIPSHMLKFYYRWDKTVSFYARIVTCM